MSKTDEWQIRLINEAFKRRPDAKSVSFRTVAGRGLGFGCVREGGNGRAVFVTTDGIKLHTAVSAWVLRAKYAASRAAARLLYGPDKPGPTDYVINRTRFTRHAGVYGWTNKYAIGPVVLTIEKNKRLKPRLRIRISRMVVKAHK